VSRHGHNKAIVAGAHSILIAACHELRDDVGYHDTRGDFFQRRADPARLTRRFVDQRAMDIKHRIRPTIAPGRGDRV
jgi:hypothetical protein